MLSVFRALSYADDKLRLVVNRYEKRADITLTDMEETLGLGIFKVVPNDYAVVTRTINQGNPIITQAPRSPVAKAVQDMAHELCHGTDQGSLLRKLLTFGRMELQ